MDINKINELTDFMNKTNIELAKSETALESVKNRAEEFKKGIEELAGCPIDQVEDYIKTKEDEIKSITDAFGSIEDELNGEPGDISDKAIETLKQIAESIDSYGG